MISDTEFIVRSGMTAVLAIALILMGAATYRGGPLLRWFLGECRAMCRTGLTGVIAVGIVVAGLLGLPFWVIGLVERL